MDVTNFSLLYALYGNESRNLYDEIYFPIIRYSLFFQMKEDVSSDGFSTLDSLKELINKKFDISIPSSILKGAIQRINNNDSDILVYEKGNSFKIVKRWEDSDSESMSVIEHKASTVNNKMQELEDKFQSFIKNENIRCDYSFSEFFSNHTSELLLFLNGEKNHQDSNEETNLTSEAKFANLMQFVKLLKEQDSELYEVAENFFWSSVIAAFLQRDQNILKDKKDVIHFYFDTSLVLALLDLADKERVIHAHDLKDMIENAGHVVYVHPMTLREIDSILTAASQNGVPDTSSGIFEAYQRRNLKPAELLRISSEMRQNLAKQQVSIFKCSESELDLAERNFQTNTDVSKLGKLRSQNKSYKIDFREIHDVFMGEFIKEERKKHKSIPSRGGKNLEYFLTFNTQLIDFYYKPSLQKEQLMIHPRNVIAKLWINGALSKDLCRSGLSEIISRCLSANNIDARSRITILVKYSEKYIEDQDQRREFCRKVYKQVIKQSNTITPLVDQAINDWNENKADESKQDDLRESLIALMKTVSEEDEYTQIQISSLKDKVSALELSNSMKTQFYAEQLDSMKSIQQNQANQIARHLENEKISKERERLLSRKSNLLEKLSSVKDKIKKEENYKHELVAARESNITDKRFYLECAARIFIFVIIITIVYFCVRNKDFVSIIIGAGISIIPIIGAVVNMFVFVSPNSEKKKKYRISQREKWEISHPEYNRTNIEISNLIKEQNEIESELKEIKNKISQLIEVQT